ncbi:hypothetical protein [Burkholderia sp. S-53]|nr:hypothetical protein [Burkholderia sp. S-53]
MTNQWETPAKTVGKYAESALCTTIVTSAASIVGSAWTAAN